MKMNCSDKSEFESVTPGNIFSNMLVTHCQMRQKC